ncbi:MAG: ribbon-helix-helix protein, CopG family [Candidatus Eremiobacteraeota bacterium]|nr:ribbon-helix-helix protein, CopG family [Candidatus Eremiobacteraeota bacterium]
MTSREEYGIEYGMPVLKSTFSLDAQSVARLQALARKWQVPKTEVVRRALQQAFAGEEILSPEQKIATLRRLQKKFAAAGVDFEKWKRETKRGRR